MTDMWAFYLYFHFIFNIVPRIQIRLKATSLVLTLFHAKTPVQKPSWAKILSQGWITIQLIWLMHELNRHNLCYCVTYWRYYSLNWSLVLPGTTWTLFSGLLWTGLRLWERSGTQKENLSTIKSHAVNLDGDMLPVRQSQLEWERFLLSKSFFCGSQTCLLSSKQALPRLHPLNFCRPHPENWACVARNQIHPVTLLAAHQQRCCRRCNLLRDPCCYNEVKCWATECQRFSRLHENLIYF